MNEGLSIRHQSPPLRDMAATLMKVSQNLYAEVLFHALGQAVGGDHATGAYRHCDHTVAVGHGCVRGRGRRRLRPVALRPDVGSGASTYC